MRLIIFTSLILIIGKNRRLFSLILGIELLYLRALTHTLIEGLRLILLLWAGVLSRVVRVTLYIKRAKNWRVQKTRTQLN